MRENVKQQAKLARIQQKQFDAMNYASNPNLLINSCECEIYSSDENGVNDICKLIPKISNKGLGEALDIRVEVRNKKFSLSERILVDEVIQEAVYLEPDLVTISERLDFLTTSFTLIYTNKFSYEIRENYKIQTVFLPDSWETAQVIVIKE